MATFKFDEELLMTCPYNSNHRIAPRRFDIHLLKCFNNYTATVETCPFNSSHRIPAEFMAAHVAECRFASNIDMVPKTEKDVQELPQTETPREQTLDPSWDNTGTSELYTIPGLEGSRECAQTAYGGNVFSYQLMSKSERKKFNENLVNQALDRAGGRKREREN